MRKKSEAAQRSLHCRASNNESIIPTIVMIAFEGKAKQTAMCNNDLGDFVIASLPPPQHFTTTNLCPATKH